MIFFPLLLAGGALALPRYSSIKWGPCDKYVPANKTATKLPLQCATLPVPLDYTAHNSSDTYNLRIMRSPTNTTSKGSVVFNPGGPGEGGLTVFGAGVDFLRAAIGPEYDLLTFDPRGTADDELSFDCYPNKEDRLLTFAPDPLARTYFDESEVAPGTIWAESKERADACHKAVPKASELLGTAFVVRDILQLYSALGEDRINYYGTSYGTVLGATLVSMFPDKVGKVVLDSVSNPHTYFNGMTNSDLVFLTDDVFSNLLSQCYEAGADRCPLSKQASSAAELEKKIFAFYDGLREKPIALPHELVRHNTTTVTGTRLDYSTIKTMTFLSLYSAPLQSVMVLSLNGTIQGNLTTFAAWRDVVESSYGTFAASEAYLGISCGDKGPRSSNPEEDVYPGIKQAIKDSRVAGGSGPSFGINSPICAQWHSKAKERYEGNFHAKTETPVFLVGNRVDPATPISQAYNVSAGFEGSRVLEVNALGHGALTNPSKCFSKAVQNYFSSGVLPKEHTVCELDDPLAWLDEAPNVIQW